MLLALAAAVLSVALGAIIAVLGGGRASWMGPTRTFALVTSVAVVLSQLLPDVLESLGLVAFGLFALGFLVPPVFERLATTRQDVVGLEMGYLGLVLHKAGDGLALGTYTGELHRGHGHLGLVIAIAAHTVPVVALVSLVFVARRGVRAAVIRAAILAVTAGAGVALTRAMPTEALADAEPWITAVVAGMLMHVVFHDWKLDRAEGSASLRRLGDVVALAAGVAILFAGGHDHHGGEGGPDVRALASRAGLDLLVETAPWLLAGLAAAALLQTLATGGSTAWRLGGAPARQALGGATVGVPMPVCACVVLPVAQSLRRRGAGAALVAAFLLSTPGIGADAFALTGHFLGWPFALARLAATVAVAFAAALLVSRVADRGGGETRVSLVDELDEPEGGPALRFSAHLGELLHHVGPWMAVSLVTAAFAHAVLSPDALAPLAGSGLDLALVSLLAIPSYVNAAAATPLAAVMIAKGLSPAAALAGLLLGPLFNLSTIGFLRGAYGTRAAALALLGALALGMVIAWGLSAAGLSPPADELADAGRDDHGPLAWAATAALGLLVLWSVWRHGLRRWLGGLGEAWSAEEHRHNHGRARPGH